MTETSPLSFSARVTVIVLALGLTVMLALSIKTRFENPHISVIAQPRPVTSDTDGADAQAIGALMRQVAANPQDLDALIQLVEHLIAAQNWPAAEAFAQRAITLDVRNPTPLYLLGVVAHNQGNNAKAAEILENVLALKDDATVRYSLGVLYIHFLHDPEKGKKHLVAALADAAAPDALKNSIREELDTIAAASKQEAETAPPAKDVPPAAAASGKQGKNSSKPAKEAR